MKLEEKHIAEIKASFERMRSKEDLLHLLNEVKPLVYGDKTVPFKLKQLTWHANPKLGGKRYTSFQVKKKSGSERTIHAPVNGLKAIQKTLALILQCVFEPHEAATGFVRKKSIVDNARIHVGRRYVYNIDLKDFFFSIEQARVWKMLQLKPFNLSPNYNKEPHGMRWEDFKEKYIGKDVDVTFWVGKGRPFTTVEIDGKDVQIFWAKNFDKDKDKFIAVAGDSIKTKGNNLDILREILITKPNNFVWEEDNDDISFETEKLKNKSDFLEMLKELARMSKYDQMPFNDLPDGFYTIQENDFELDEEVQDFIQINSVTYTFKKSEGKYEVSDLDNSFSQEDLEVFVELSGKSMNDISSHEKRFTILNYSTDGFDVEDEKAIDIPKVDVRNDNTEDLVEGQINILPETKIELNENQSKKNTVEGKSIGGSLWLVNKVPDTNRLQIANIIANICCTEMEVERKNDVGEWEHVKRNVLPQGAPTSPVLTNVICQRLDYLLTGVAKRFGLKYSRYADDITFSSMHNVFQPGSEFLAEVNRIIAQQNFHIKENKTRLQKDGYRKEVTGLLVNEKANVQKRYIKQLRMWLYYWERYGYKKALGFFLEQYIAEKGHVKNGKPDMANVISGKLDYLKMVKGADNEMYKKLKNRFAKCLGMTLDINLDVEVLNSENNQALIKAMQAIIGKQLEAQLMMEDTKAKQIKVSREMKKLEFANSRQTHNPKKLAELLRKFTSDESPIKYSTHPIEKKEQFTNFDEFVSNFKEGELIEIKNINPDFWDYLIYPFLFQSNDETRFDSNKNPINSYYWGEHELKLGWKYKDLLKQMFEKQRGNSNIKIYPLSTNIDRQLQPETRIEGKFLNTWNDFVEVFKNEIEFRYHNLEKTITTITSPLRTNFDNNIIIEGLSGLNFYTYTSKIKEALSLLIHPYNQYATGVNPKLIIRGKYNEAEKKIIILIINVDSYWDAMLDEEVDKVSLKSGKGQLLHIKELLYGLCDWSLETRLRINDVLTFCRINYLGPKYKVSPIEKNIEKPLGHTHILTFYI